MTRGGSVLTRCGTAYQSALLTTPLLVIWMLMRLIGFWSWLRYVTPTRAPITRINTLTTAFPTSSKTFLILGISATAYTAFRAFRDPNTTPGGSAGQAQAAMMNNGVVPRFYLPVIGDFAER